MPYPQIQGLLTDIGTEELGHLEMVASIVHQLTRNMTPEEVKNGYAPQVVFVDEENKIVRTTTYEKHGLLKDMA